MRINCVQIIYMWPKLEELARELETMADRQDELAEVISHVRNDSYDRQALVAELKNLKLGFFAYKLHEGYYDIRRPGFVKHMEAQLKEPPAEAPDSEPASSPEPATEVEDKQPGDQEQVEEQVGETRAPDYTEEQPLEVEKEVKDGVETINVQEPAQPEEEGQGDYTLGPKGPEPIVPEEQPIEEGGDTMDEENKTDEAVQETEEVEEESSEDEDSEEETADEENSEETEEASAPDDAHPNDHQEVKVEDEAHCMRCYAGQGEEHTYETIEHPYKEPEA